MLENLGAKLKTARVNKGLSRKQVSELIGVSVSVIGLYESGERIPSVPILMKLATQYQVSVDYLLDIEHPSDDTLSLDGLNSKQIQALKLTADCFRNNAGRF